VSVTQECLQVLQEETAVNEQQRNRYKASVSNDRLRDKRSLEPTPVFTGEGMRHTPLSLRRGQWLRRGDSGASSQITAKSPTGGGVAAGADDSCGGKGRKEETKMK